MDHHWAQVRSCNSLHDAHFVKSVLESEGIDVQLPDEYSLGVQPFLGNAIGGVKVLVPFNDLQRANEILEAVQIVTNPADADADAC
jgi:hypothetical protein